MTALNLTQEREAAEAEYATSAFNYAREPIGSYAWGIYWKGWQARAALAQSPAPIPKWIDNLKGSDPTIDGLIEYIEGRAQSPVSATVPITQLMCDWKTGMKTGDDVCIELFKHFSSAPAVGRFDLTADLRAIDCAMQYMGGQVNKMDAVEEGDLKIVSPGFEAIARLLAVPFFTPASAQPRPVPDSECMQSHCAATTTGCWGECCLKLNRGSVLVNAVQAAAPVSAEGMQSFTRLLDEEQKRNPMPETAAWNGKRIWSIGEDQLANVVAAYSAADKGTTS